MQNELAVATYCVAHILDIPWDPSSLEVPDKLILHFTDGTSGNTVGARSLYTPKVSQETASQTTKHSRERLGWLPTGTPSRKRLTPLPSLLGPSRYSCPYVDTSRLDFPSSTNTDLPKPLPLTRCSVLTPGLGGITCAQLFVGKSSHFTSVYGMRTESEGPSALQDFIREHSIPNILRNDNSKMQTGTAWNNILRKYSIKAKLTKPHHPQQNPAERRIKTIKTYTSKILDRTGAPSRNVVPLSAVFGVPPQPYCC